MNTHLLPLAFALATVLTSTARAEADSSAALEWKTEAGGPTARIALELGPDTPGVWVAFFERGDQQVLPLLFAGGKFAAGTVPVANMTELELVADVAGAEPHRALLFARERALGIQGVLAANVYHLLITRDFIDGQDLTKLSEPDQMPAKLKSYLDGFRRLRRLALNYAAQSDQRTREMAEAFGVDARFDRPRLILTSEEWIEIPKEVQESKPAGPFGALTAALEPKVVAETAPTYGVDVLADGVAAGGEYALGFQNARSTWNDLLEGKVIHDATSGERRILTASLVFAQLGRERAEKGIENRILRVRDGDLELLDQREGLWPSAKESIRSFLAEHPDWSILIPEKPVDFYQGERKLYSLYAWFRVHDATGRMIGMLPNGAHGAMTDELARLGGGIRDQALEKIANQAGGGAVKGFFSQVAGMYVAAGGILDGISMTIADPTLLDRGAEAWHEFLGLHAVEYCQQFLEDNASQYDSYSAQLGFWQGALVLIGAVGGRKAVEEGARRAVEGVAGKAKKDLEDWANQQLEQGGEIAGEALDQARSDLLGEYDRFVDGLERARDALETGEEIGERGAEYYRRAEELRRELESFGG